ncbi:MAG: hypothetical protein LBL13_12995 [Bacteroidales bacterium]|nr:hypothetical protein [Bacteroidales bacterium]
METKNNENSSVDFDDIQINPRFTALDKHLFPIVDIDNLDVNTQKFLKYERYKQDTKERKLLSHWVITVVSAWLFFTLLILAFNHPWRLNISEAVCCMLLGTTTINILGLVFIVLKDLFPENKK